ncbi:MAG: hypothetical protein QXL24_03300, partial [Candidatus Jordarchaeaceae archaeon]
LQESINFGLFDDTLRTIDKNGPGSFIEAMELVKEVFGPDDAEYLFKSQPHYMTKLGYTLRSLKEKGVPYQKNLEYLRGEFGKDSLKQAFINDPFYFEWIFTSQFVLSSSEFSRIISELKEIVGKNTLAKIIVLPAAFDKLMEVYIQKLRGSGQVNMVKKELEKLFGKANVEEAFINSVRDRNDPGLFDADELRKIGDLLSRSPSFASVVEGLKKIFGENRVINSFKKNGVTFVSLVEDLVMRAHKVCAKEEDSSAVKLITDSLGEVFFRLYYTHLDPSEADRLFREIEKDPVGFLKVLISELVNKAPDIADTLMKIRDEVIPRLQKQHGNEEFNNIIMSHNSALLSSELNNTLTDLRAEEMGEPPIEVDGLATLLSLNLGEGLNDLLEKNPYMFKLLLRWTDNQQDLEAFKNTIAMFEKRYGKEALFSFMQHLDFNDYLFLMGKLGITVFEQTLDILEECFGKEKVKFQFINSPHVFRRWLESISQDLSKSRTSLIESVNLLGRENFLRLFMENPENALSVKYVIESIPPSTIEEIIKPIIQVFGKEWIVNRLLLKHSTASWLTRASYYFLNPQETTILLQTIREVGVEAVKSYIEKNDPEGRIDLNRFFKDLLYMKTQLVSLPLWAENAGLLLKEGIYPTLSLIKGLIDNPAQRSQTLSRYRDLLHKLLYEIPPQEKADSVEIDLFYPVVIRFAIMGEKYINLVYEIYIKNPTAWFDIQYRDYALEDIMSGSKSKSSGP